ncbi:MAG: hypothetical protein ACO1OB_09690 [Archangium sp.]
MNEPKREELVKRAAAESLDVPLAPPSTAFDHTVIDQELRRVLSALGPGFSMTMMFSAALLIGAGVAVEWALPDFTPLPFGIALGCFLGALSLPLYARTQFRKTLVTAGLRLGLGPEEADARARSLLREWSLVNRSDGEG